MTLTFSDIRSVIKRHLSVIGKRMYTKEGQNMFSNITVSTAEDAIFDQYISSGAQTIEAMLRQLVSSFSLTSMGVTMVLTNTRGSADFDARCTEIVRTFLTFYSIGEYLSMAHPDLAKKYQDDAAGAMQSLLTYAFYKNPPESSSSGYADINGTVTQAQ